MLELVRVNLIHVDRVVIRTATGPGGVAGGRWRCDTLTAPMLSCL
jgi:hypothetical protein